MDKTDQYEGFKKDIYTDTTGNKTVGTGINLNEKHNQKILPKDVVDGKRAITPAEDKVAKDANEKIAESDARDFVGDNYDNLDPEAKSVLVDMHYNVGGPKMKGFKKLQAASKEADYSKMADEIENSKYAKQTGNRAKDHIKTLRGLAQDNKDLGDGMKRMYSAMKGTDDSAQ